MSGALLLVACIAVAGALLFIVVRRAATRAERDAKLRARPPWDGSASGEGKE